MSPASAPLSDAQLDCARRRAPRTAIAADGCELPWTDGDLPGETETSATASLSPAPEGGGCPLYSSFAGRRRLSFVAVSHAQT
jgi:hypothetical protein